MNKMAGDGTIDAHLYEPVAVLPLTGLLLSVRQPNPAPVDRMRM